MLPPFHPPNATHTKLKPLNRTSFTIFSGGGGGVWLAHLSRRLTSTHAPASVRPSSSVHIFKDLLRNRLVNQSQILCGASLGRGNESWFAASGSHDYTPRPYMVKPLQKSSSPEPMDQLPRNLVCSIWDSSP